MKNANNAVETETGFGSEFDLARAQLDQFVASKAAAVKAGHNPIGALMAYVSNGLPMSVDLLTQLAEREHGHVVELIDNAVAEMAAAVRVQEYLIDESKMRDLNLLAGLVIDQAHTVVNAVEDCIKSAKGSHLRFSARTLDVYADRYEQFVNLVESLSLTEQVGQIWKEVSYNHSLVSFAQMSLENHINWQMAQLAPKRAL